MFKNSLGVSRTLGLGLAYNEKIGDYPEINQELF